MFQTSHCIFCKMNQRYLRAYISEHRLDSYLASDWFWNTVDPGGPMQGISPRHSSSLFNAGMFLGRQKYKHLLAIF